jgi:cytochrome c oxidase subunit 2
VRRGGIDECRRKTGVVRVLLRILVAGSVTALLALASACSAGTSASPTSPATRGERIARANGCAGCHGENFEGGAGPGWVGLAGSTVTLVDGSTVVADDDYLTRAIADPAAELVAGYTLKMPANDLTAEEIADIVAFINTLAAP